MGPVPPSRSIANMDNAFPKAFARVLDSVRLPLQHFLDTGFWNPNALPGYASIGIAETQVRSSCRLAAKEMKRPFIICGTEYRSGSHKEGFDTGGKRTLTWVPHPEPVFSRGFIQVPKRKYLVNHIASLTLAGDNRMICDRCTPTLWEFTVHDKALWDEYYAYVLNDPACRKARKLTS